MRRMVRLLSGCFLLLALLGGCSFAAPRVGEPGPSVPSAAEEKAYQSTLEHFTDHAEVYDLLDTRLFAAITYQSWPFRESRVHRLAIFHGQPPPLVEKKLAAGRSAFNPSHQFFFRLQLTNY